MTTDRNRPRPPAGLDEALEILLPDATEQQRGEAERVADFLRLLQADAARAGDRTALDLGRAREDLARSGLDRLEDALHDLCAHHLAAVVGPDRFLGAARPARSAPAAWRALEVLRGEYDGLADLPAPGERASDTFARLVESLARYAGDGLARLWHARFVAAVRGAREGEDAFRELTAAEGDVGADARVWSGVVECLLDRGAVHRALDLAVECAPRFADDARLQRLAVWCELLAGRHDDALSRDARLGPWRGDLPGVLAPLRHELPSCAAALSGRRSRAPRPADAVAVALDRTDYGAQLLAVVQRHADGTAEWVAGDAAPALRGRMRRWFEDRDDAASDAGTPEHRLVRDAAAVAWHRVDGADLPDSLGGVDSRAAILQPIFDDAGEACGWIRVECSHHLLPSRARLAALAEAWRGELLLRRGRWESSGATAGTARDDGRAREGEVYERLVDDLGIKTARRAWYGFVLDEDRPTLVAQGGDGLGDLEAAPGGARLLWRALSCGGAARADEPDASLYLHAQSAAGVAIALRAGDRRIGALVIESERRRDFDEADLARFAAVVDRHALVLRLQQFRRYHEDRFERAVHADATSPGFRDFHAGLRRAGASADPLVLVGPPGCGKRVFARWAWFESRGDDAPRVECTALEWLQSEARDPAYLVGVEDLAPTDQRRLLHALECPGVLRGMAVGLREDPRVAGRDGRLAPELAALFDRECRRVPGFAERRTELLRLADHRLDDLASAAGGAAPELDDTARAFLWRQAWTGNWRELDARLFHLVRRDRRAPVTAEDLAALWTRSGVDAVTRLPSRDPDPALLHEALLATATAGGRANKRRAALYLGWDPDTLTSRLAEAGIAGPDPGRRGAAWTGEGRGTPAEG